MKAAFLAAKEEVLRERPRTEVARRTEVAIVNYGRDWVLGRTAGVVGLFGLRRRKDTVGKGESLEKRRKKIYTEHPAPDLPCCSDARAELGAAQRSPKSPTVGEPNL